MQPGRSVQIAALLLIVSLQMASAQQGVTMSRVNPDSSITQNSFVYATAGGPAVNAPAPGPAGTFKFWDVLTSLKSPSTDYYSQPPYITALPLPQIAAGPNDIFTVFNRSIARYPNPNAPGNTGAPQPLTYHATDSTWLDVWLGTATITGLCPSGRSGNSPCVIDNTSIRYDQMQGRFVVLFTVTDMSSHTSNFVLVVSKRSQFTNCATPAATCPAIGTIFSTPVAGGNQAGLAAANWIYYAIPVNLAYHVQPTALGNGLVGTATAVTTGGQHGIPFVSAPFCATGGSGSARACTNYFPTGARMGIDNDNITLVAPVLDQMNNNVPEGQLPFFSGTGTDGQPFNIGPYAGTRVVTVPKLLVYNSLPLPMGQPPACDPSSCGAVNLSDNISTGTLTEVGGCNVASPSVACAPSGASDARTQPIRAIFWEPANLRGQALASFDSQIAPQSAGNLAGIVTPIQYLVGHQISVNGAGGFNSNQIFLQPIVFSCPGAGPNGQVPDQPVLGPLQSNAATIAGLVTSAKPVGQGMSASHPTADDGTPEANNRLFVGDSRPAQILFRGGLFLHARTIRPYDSMGNPLATSTTLYDLLRNCPTNAGMACAYSADGSALTAASLAQEYARFNEDSAGNAAGFGSYAPMVESPADIVSNGPVSPINVFAWLDKLFVGMTTGGPTTTAGVFSKNFASLWAYRPGDDAFDRVEPVIDPYTGAVPTAVPCAGTETASGNLTQGSRTITGVPDTANIQTGTYIVASGVPVGSVVSAITPSGPGGPGTITWSSASPGAFVTANGVSLSFIPSSFVVAPLIHATGNVTSGNQTITDVPDTSQIAPGMFAAGPGIPIPATVLSVTPSSPGPGTVTLSSRATGSGMNVPLVFSTSRVLFDQTLPPASCPLDPWSNHGGASTDPVDGSLWVYGEVATQRLATIPGPGQFKSTLANYALEFPVSDPVNGNASYFPDVQPGNAFFPWIQIAKNLNIAQPAGETAGASGIVPQFQACEHGNPPPNTPPAERCREFNPANNIKRGEAAYWIVRSQMDETAVTNFLCATGGDPSGLASCPGISGAGHSTFGDLGTAGSKIDNPFVQASIPGFQVITNRMLMRYIEVMARRGYAKAQTGKCSAPGSASIKAQVRFCPNDPVTRGAYAEFLIRAKLNNVFPTSLLGGIQVAPGSNDNLANMLPASPYFSDVSSASPSFLIVQAIRELGIAGPESGTNFDTAASLTRAAAVQLAIRAFFL